MSTFNCTIVVDRPLTMELEFVVISAFFCILWIRVFFFSQTLVLHSVVKLVVLATSMRSPIVGLNMATRLL